MLEGCLLHVYTCIAIIGSNILAGTCTVEPCTLVHGAHAVILHKQCTQDK